jgi:hypothetical protein
VNRPFSDAALHRWRRIRQAGKARYILLRWVCPIAIPMSVVMAFLAITAQALRNHHPITPVIYTDTPRLIFYIALYLIFVGGIVAVFADRRWRKNEVRLQENEKQDDP